MTPPIDLRRLDSTPSTHDALRGLWREARGGLPTGVAVATERQTAGRGRHGRAWIAPAGKCLALSVLVVADDSEEAAEGFAWLSLAAGVAVREVLARHLDDPARLAVKWPNDVLLDGRKVCGILGELLDAAPGRLAASIGMGLNIDLAEEELPVPHATSLALAGARLDAGARERLAEELAAALLERVERLQSAGWDARRSGLAAELDAACSTIGVRVRATLPGGAVITGLATGLDLRGRLVIERDDEGPGERRFAVTAGEVERVRPADG